MRYLLAGCIVLVSFVTAALGASGRQHAPPGSFEGAPPEFTHFTAAELSKGFLALAFGSDLRIGARPLGIRRFDRPIRARVIGGGSVDRTIAMSRVIQEYARDVPALGLAFATSAAAPDIEVRLVDEHGTPVAPGSPGGIEVRGPAVFAEYWARPHATRDAFRDGWFITGDTAVVENGVYRILGRTNLDILKTGGHKVSALEIEEALRQHPAVAECGVVGKPDEERGMIVSAFIVLKGNFSASNEMKKDLQEHVKRNIAPYKYPREIEFVAALPRTETGKLQRFKLRTPS